MAIGYTWNVSTVDTYPTKDSKNDEASPAEQAFIQLGVDRYCCRRHLMTHVDIIDKI